MAIRKEQGLECWSNGVLGLKADIDLIFTLLPLVMRNSNMVYIFPLYQPFINPILSTIRRHHSNAPGTITCVEPLSLVDQLTGGGPNG